MTKEDLKKKIVGILKEAYMPKYHGEPTIYYCIDDEYAPEVYYPTDEDVADALISAGIGDVSEWKHRAKRAEKTMIRLAEKYVDAAKINTIKDVNGKIYFAERQACVTYVATMEMLESEKEFQEERKDD